MILRSRTGGNPHWKRRVAEPTPQASADYIKITYAELYNATSDAVSALLSLGIKAGDRVASYSTNCIVCAH